MAQSGRVHQEGLIAELRKALLLFHSFDPYLLLDETMTIQAANGDLARLFNCRESAEQLQGQALKKMHCPNLEKLVSRFHETGESRLDSTVACKGERGEQQLLDVRLSRVDEGSDTGLILCSLRDITERIRQEERLWQSNEELTILYEMSQVEVRSLQHEDILQNVLARFSELTNLDKGFFVRNPRHKVTGPEQISYNLSETEIGVVRDLIQKKTASQAFFPGCFLPVSGFRRKAGFFPQDEGARI